MQKPPIPSTLLSRWPGRIVFMLLLSLFIRRPSSGGIGKSMAGFDPFGFYLSAEKQCVLAPPARGDRSFPIPPAAQDRWTALVSFTSHSPPAIGRMKIPNIRCPDGFVVQKASRAPRDDDSGENCRAISQGRPPPEACTRPNGRN